ncbi:MAG: oxidative damage protection protein [Cellvibrionaceae bacterium]|nr:oxidative damage protection protein [Cellvibrionaceae bacterium]
MTATVFCRKYKQQLEALSVAPLPGAKGQEIVDSVSKKAWGEWMQLQTQLINEKQLNLMDMGARTYLNEQMDKFFNGDQHDRAEGYVPE